MQGRSRAARIVGVGLIRIGASPMVLGHGRDPQLSGGASTMPADLGDLDPAVLDFGRAEFGQTERSARLLHQLHRILPLG